jgi:NAD(P)-dependent dehydrogenase (short-subunit alcohol dehydrogenase family)
MDVNQRVEWMRENSKETYEEAKQCIRTNYYGAKIVTEALLPLLQLSSSGRIVNVSSGFGLLRVSSVNTKLLPFAGHWQECFARICLQTAVACLNASLLFLLHSNK